MNKIQRKLVLKKTKKKNEESLETSRNRLEFSQTDNLSYLHMMLINKSFHSKKAL